MNTILLEASVLLDHNQNSPSLRTAADSLLRRLRYSKIRTAVFYDSGLSASQVHLLEELAGLNAFDSLILSASSVEDVVSGVNLISPVSKANCLLIISCQNTELSVLKKSGWLLAILCTSCQGSTHGEIASVVDKLEELPSIICRLNKKASGMGDLLVIGYIMKPSREEDFAKRGALPLSPTPNGLIFFPLNHELSIASQLQQVDVVLHKATDEIFSLKMGNSAEIGNEVIFTEGMQKLQRCIESQTGCCIIDPFQKIYPILDRLKIQQILVGLERVCTGSTYRIRGPRFLQVDSFEDPDLQQRLNEAKLSLPNLVKPQVACGVADAHSMAIVFKVDDYKGLNVPLPAVIQEYVDHSSRLFKFYVLGKKVFYAMKKSIPNAATLMNSSGETKLKPLLFDSLKSLPISKENHQLDVGSMPIDHNLVTDAAHWLRDLLDLTIFGFDVVVEESTGDHVIVDLNYLPSFKEVPDDEAIPAFWEAMKERFEMEKSKRSAAVS